MEPRAGEGPRHEQGRNTVTAAYVRYRRAALELLDHARERGQPLLNEMMLVTGSEEAGSSAEKAFRPLVPAHALTGSEGPADLRLVPHRGGYEIADGGQEEGAILFRQHRG